ncbi:MAG TPA: PhzF family phenazine biosynthesis protein [Sphingomicrobium sp.]|nr:PhzF family phenazine biosynthesis protein [Sphingomicrobium sp.]
MDCLDLGTDPAIPGADDDGKAPGSASPRRAHYELADVFTTKAFGGNPLALFPDASAIPDPWLQRIAAELNLSETAFAYPMGEREWRLRIFTPTMEHPFAGHPTIGSALLLAEAHELTELTLHEQVGPVRLTIDRPKDRSPIARLSVPVDPEERPVDLPLEEIAEMVSLDAAQIGSQAIAPRAMSCGVPFLFIRVRDRRALGAARLQKDRWEKLIARSWAPHVYLFVVTASGDVQARMFAPLMGIEEDPATGGAAAALAGVLAVQERVRSGEARWSIAQGIEMGRPSTLELTAQLEGGRASRIRVGGSAVRMGRGSLDLALMEQSR